MSVTSKVYNIGVTVDPPKAKSSVSLPTYFPSSVFCQCHRESNEYLLVSDETSWSEVVRSVALHHLFPTFCPICVPIKYMSWTKKWKLWCWRTLCQNIEMSEVWKWGSHLWGTGAVLKRPQSSTKISGERLLCWKRTMGSGLGLVSDKTHRVLSSFVGEE